MFQRFGNLSHFVGAVDLGCEGMQVNRYFDKLVVRQNFSVPRTGISDNQKQFILDDQNRGMSAIETLRYWPFDERITLDQIKRSRIEGQGR